VANNGGCASQPSSSFNNGAQLAQPVGAVTGSLTYCPGGNTTLTASGGVSYIWVDSSPAIISTSASATVTQGVYAVQITAANSCKDTVIVNVSQLPAAAISITGALNYCQGGNTTLTATGGSSYVWNDAGNSTTASITVTQGTYTVTATDANTCTGTAAATVTELPQPVINISGNLSYCVGGNTTITASGAANYLWNDAGNSTTASITVAQGTYTVTGTDVSSCSATASVVVTENAAPTVTITGSLTYCTGGNTTLTATGGVGYIWSDGSTTASVTVTQGTYTVSATDANGCTGSATATVVQSSSLTVNIAGTLSYCQGASTTITASGGTNYVWNDANNSTTPSITVTAGTYSVTASDATGCTGTASATVTQSAAASVSIAGNLSYCTGSNTTLTASGAASYVWNDAGNSTIASITVTQGSYTVTGTDANGCTATASVTVTENAGPTVTISGLLTYCTGGNSTLTASGGTAYAWSTGETTASITVTQGTYSVTATDGSTCTASTSVTVTESSTLNVTVSGSLNYCPGTNTTLTASGGTSYVWSNGSTAVSITVTQGSYTVTATDASCSGTSSAVVTETITAPLNLGSDVTAFDDSTVTLNAGNGFSSYLWSGGETTQTITPQTSGTYSVTVTDVSGCTISDAINVTYTPRVEINNQIYIPTAFSPNGDGANDIFRARAFVNVKQFSLRIYNRWGEQVFETADITEGWDGMHKGTAQPLSSYTWYAEYTFADGSRHTDRGNVTLVK
jgi:gliding motility-associated-like protein